MYMTNTFLFLKTLRLEAGTRAITVTPHAARLLRRRRIAAQPAAVTLGPATADLSRTRVILAGRRDITIAGSASLTRQLLLTCQPAEISLSTSEAILQRTRLAGFIKTEITVEPQPARLLRNLVLKCQPAAVELTPNTANFLKVMGSIEAQPQAITIQGRPADLRAARLLTASPAAVVVGPRPAQLLRAYPLVAQPVGIAVLPRPAILRMSRVLKAVKQDIALAPKAADLIYTIPRSVAFVDKQSSGTTASSFTIPISFGPAGAKTVYVMLPWIGTSSGRTLNTVTIGGVAATRLSRVNGASQTVNLELWKVDGITATSGNVVATFNNTTYGLPVYLWYGLNTASLVLKNTGNFYNAATGTSISASLTVTPGDFILACAAWDGGSSTTSWTGLANVDMAMPGDYHAAGGEYPSVSGTRTVTCTLGTSRTQRLLLSAAIG